LRGVARQVGVRSGSLCFGVASPVREWQGKARQGWFTNSYFRWGLEDDSYKSKF